MPVEMGMWWGRGSSVMKWQRCWRKKVRVSVCNSALASASSEDLKNAVAQDLHDQEEAGEEDEAEQADSSLDPYAYGQHHQVQREAQALAPHEARVLKWISCFGF
ncbi:uncharacterized protein LOC100852602 [Vitis vinifera]|uniref:uncharacterized protein LOC100852602 n=1 Tax=Vitis vinifera TaxID=29760 RepID=UPI0028831AB2|nr:uncharacterized protein LOC100852602 [Vitis vinifera]